MMWCLRPSVPAEDLAPSPTGYTLTWLNGPSPIPSKTAYGRIAESQNRRIEESQTRQSDLPETPIPSTQSNCTLPEPVKSVESLAESREERAASSDCSGSGPYHRFSLARHRGVSSFIVPSKNDHLVLGKFRFDGRWSIAIAIAIAIKYRISSAAWIGGVSKLVTLSLCVGL